MKITNFSLIMVAMVLIYMMAQPVSAQEKLQNDSVALVNVNSSSEPSLRVSIPASPQALAFQRVGEFDVNNSSGIPDINIPLLKFRKWFKYGLKAQKLLAQGIALGIIAINKAPCKGKSFVNCLILLKLLPLQGDKLASMITQGAALG